MRAQQEVQRAGRRRTCGGASARWQCASGRWAPGPLRAGEWGWQVHPGPPEGWGLRRQVPRLQEQRGSAEFGEGLVPLPLLRLAIAGYRSPRRVKFRASTLLSAIASLTQRCH